MDEDTEAAAWHQLSQEQREREERCRKLQRELIDETKVFEEWMNASRGRIRTNEQERYRNGDHGKRNRW